LVIAERGSDWIGWARRLQSKDGSTIVLAQPSSEDDASFAYRVRARIERLQQQGTAVDRAAFVGSDRADAATRALRSSVLRRLASFLGGSGRAARLYVDAAARAGHSTQRLMRAIGWALADLARGTPLKVLVQRSSDLES
jgi:hypothetical protein